VSEGDLATVPPGDYAQISIRDNGRGIPEENLSKIFDPYFTTKGTVTQKGLGLGLTIVYSIIKKHGGYITVSSRVSHGTTVDIFLPVSPTS
jgi:signal transduction histidine kinase